MNRLNNKIDETIVNGQTRGEATAADTKVRVQARKYRTTGTTATSTSSVGG